MINNYNNTTLYIIKENDTLQNIATSFNTSIEEIYKHNPLLRNHHISANTPIILPLTNNLREKDNIKADFPYEILYLTRFAIDSKLYIPSRFNIINQKLEKTISDYIISMFSKNNNDLIYLYNFLNKCNYDIIDLIKTNNINKIKEIILRKKEKIKEYTTFSNNSLYIITLTKIKECDSLWLTYIFKITSSQFNECETIFESIKKVVENPTTN